MVPNSVIPNVLTAQLSVSHLFLLHGQASAVKTNGSSLTLSMPKYPQTPRVCRLVKLDHQGRQKFTVYPKALVFINCIPFCLLYFVQYNKTNMTSLWGVQHPRVTILSQGIHSCCIPHRDIIFVYWLTVRKVSSV